MTLMLRITRAPAARVRAIALRSFSAAPQQQTQGSDVDAVSAKVKQAWNYTAAGYVASHCTATTTDRPMHRVHRLAAQVYMLPSLDLHALVAFESGMLNLQVHGWAMCSHTLCTAIVMRAAGSGYSNSAL
eukprot:12374-Heterococcus_DN1.PRE.6